MDESELRLEKVLGAARAGMSPSDADCARLRRIVLATAAGTAVAVSTTQVAAASAGKAAGVATQIGAGHAGLFSVVTGLSTGAKLVAVGVCVTAAATGVLAVRAQSPAPMRTSSTQVPLSQPHKMARAAHTNAEPAAPLINASATEEPAPAAVQPELQAAQPKTRGALAAKSSHAAAQPEAETPNPLTAELVLIQQARQSLNAGNPNAALSALSAHATQFPTGVMAEERRALQALALCAQGDPRGKQQAEQFLQETPDSPLAAHLRDGCQ